MLLHALDRIAHSEQPLPILTQVLEIVALCPSAPSPAMSATLHTLACRHYGQRRPGYETYSRALARVLLKEEPERYLSKCLSSHYMSAQAEALHHVEGLLNQDEPLNTCVQTHLLQLVNNEEASSINRATVARLLSADGSLTVKHDDIRKLVEMYRSTPVPVMRHSLLPLISKLLDGEGSASESTLYIKEEIVGMVDDESSAAREMACKAMSGMPSWPKEDAFQFYYHLALFLQDDDIDVRQAAGSIASAHLAQGQPMCTSRATELAWHACRTAASAKDAQWLLDGLVQDWKECSEAAQAGSQLLFAVERANMHIDITTNMQQSALVLQEHQASLQCVAASYHNAGGTFISQQEVERQGLVGKSWKNRKAANTAEQHELHNAYKSVQAQMISSAITPFSKQ